MSGFTSYFSPGSAFGWAQWLPPSGGAFSHFAEVVEQLDDFAAREDASLVFSRLYVERSFAAKALALWQSTSLGDPQRGCPPTVIANRGCGAGPLSGFQCLLLRGDCGIERSVGGDEIGPSIVLSDSGRKVLILGPPSGDSPASHSELFGVAASRLRSAGFTFADVARTWLYVDPLIESYPELNEARDRTFSAAGMGQPGSYVLPPASTGIQGIHPQGHRAFMDIIALRSEDDERPFEPIQPRLQPQAWSYGPSFSRGMLIPLWNTQLITISGTASIAEDGTTFAVGNPEEQVRTTLRNISSLLETVGCDLETPAMWNLYFKNEETWRTWNQLREDDEFSSVQGPGVFADVCRSELLFEAEVTLLA